MMKCGSFYSVMDFSKRDFTAQEKIELLQRWILVHSYLYYCMDLSIVTDHTYDMNSKQLFELRVEHPDSWANARYTYAMEEFDGSTGFGLVEKLDENERKSIMWDVQMLTGRHVLKRRKKR